MAVGNASEGRGWRARAARLMAGLEAAAAAEERLQRRAAGVLVRWVWRLTLLSGVVALALHLAQWLR